MRSWTRPVAVIAGVTIVVDVLMVGTNMGPSLALVSAVGVLIGIGIWFTIDLARVAVRSGGVGAEVAVLPRARTDLRVARLHRGLAYSRSGDVSFERLRTELVDLVDDQLRAVHDVDRARDPERASAILGPELDRFVSDDSTASTIARPRTLDRIVTLIEQL